MNKLSRGGIIAREIEAQTRLATSERNPLQKAYDDYHEMERQRDMALDQVDELTRSNVVLMAELKMLRENYQRSENDRVRFQSISATLLGRLLAINDCIGGAVRASIGAGIEPVYVPDPDIHLEQAGKEAQAIIQSFPATEPPMGQVTPEASPEPPAALGGALPAALWP